MGTPPPPEATADRETEQHLREFRDAYADLDPATAASLDAAVAAADRETGTAAVYCRITKNPVARTQEVIPDRVLIDWDADGEIVGVEILDAKVPGGPWIVTRGAPRASISNDPTELYSVLCDFFERHVLQPGALGAAADDPFRHTSTEARKLTNALLERLRDEGARELFDSR